MASGTRWRIVCDTAPPARLTAAGRSGNLHPAGSCVEGIRRCAIERDGGIGSVSSHQIDHLLEQLKLTFRRPHTAADNDALPRLGTQGMTDERLHRRCRRGRTGKFNANAVLGESSDAHLDCVRYRLRVPGPGTRYGSSPITRTRGTRGVVSTRGGYARRPIVGTSAPFGERASRNSQPAWPTCWPA